MSGKSASLAAVLIVCGCQSIDQELLEAQLPESPSNWTAVSTGDTMETLAGVPTGDWIAAFEDSQLKSLIHEAMGRNNTLLAAAANLEAAREADNIAFGNRLPTLDVTPRAGRSAIVLNPTFAAQAGGGAGGLGDFRIQDLEDQFGV
ncbi:MAG: hypothetical protein AAGH38_07720, partial [Pseudomonadota bacterium]